VAASGLRCTVAGGVGASAVMIAAALGARVVAVDISGGALALATDLGAEITLDGSVAEDTAEMIREATGGGCHVSVDALGSPETCVQSVNCLRRRGRHVQIGLLLGQHTMTAVPMARVISHELEIVGSHGMQAHAYGQLLAMVEAGRLHPERLVDRTVTLAEGVTFLTQMDAFRHTGITVIDRF